MAAEKHVYKQKVQMSNKCSRKNEQYFLLYMSSLLRYVCPTLSPFPKCFSINLVSKIATSCAIGSKNSARSSED